jgi:hypothetical protein
VAGIVIGAASAFLLVAIILAMFARRDRQDKEDRNALSPAPHNLALDDGDDDEGATKPVKQDKTGAAAVLGATTPDYGNNNKPKQPTQTLDQMYMEKDMEATGDDHVHRDDSSNAGSSGWSSSAGVSSLNTGSADGLDDPVVGIAAGGATLAAIAGTAAIRRTSDSEKSDTHSNASASRTDLDNAIEAGDWAAVGKSNSMSMLVIIIMDARKRALFTDASSNCFCFFSTHV